MEQKKNAFISNNAVKRTANGSLVKKRPMAPASVDRELALAMGQFAKNGAIVKSADGKSPKLYCGTMYVSADVQGISGKKGILTENTRKLVGVTNFDGNKLNAGRHVVIECARVLYSTDGATITSADWQNNDRLPAELQNAEISILQGGERVFVMPLTDLQGYKFEEFRKITDRPFVRNIEPITIEIELPEGVTMPSASDSVNHFLRFEVRVTELKGVK